MKKTGSELKVAFMELSDPSLEKVILDGIKLGIKTFKILPLFFSQGKHLKLDIPQQILLLQKEHNIEIHLLPPVGEHPIFINAIDDIVQLEKKTDANLERNTIPKP